MREKLRKVRKFTEDTVISLSMVLAVCAIVLAASRVLFQLDANSAAIKELDDKQKGYNITVQHIDSRLAHIEGALSIKGQ
jgi:hypothetical protein